MSKEQSYQNAASELLRLVGGKENVISAAHCATRLRLVLKDESKADVDGILKTELVKGQFSTGGQFQIIIGSGTVDEVYKYFIQYADIKESTKNEVKKAADQKMNPLQKLVKMLADVFRTDYSGTGCQRSSDGSEQCSDSRRTFCLRKVTC